MSNTVHLAKRMGEIRPFHVMDLLARARQLEAQGRSIIHLEIGEPDFATADSIINAGHNALDNKYTHYTPSMGLPALRQTIADYYLKRYDLHIDARRIVVTPGASGALHLALAVLINPGEQVLMADPGYPCNRHFVRLLEGKALSVPVTVNTAYQLTADLLQDHWNDAVVAAMVASPSNPTGTLVSKSQMQSMVDFIDSKSAAFLVDEIYQGLVYDADDYTALSLSNNIFVINSFSKYFGMTGWRLGWLVVPEAYIDAVDRLAQNIFLAAPTLSQYAALEAFSEKTLMLLDQRRDEFKKRRDFLLPALQELGFKIPVKPEGAFYIYADCSKFTHDAYSFVYKMLEEVGVAVTPGIDFGSNRANLHVRFAYTRSIAVLEQAVDRMAKFLNKY